MLEKIFRYLYTHNTIVQLVLFVIVIFIQVICHFVDSSHYDIFIYTILVLMTLELIQISVLLHPPKKKTENEIGPRTNQMFEYVVKIAKSDIYITGISNAHILRHMLDHKSLLKYCLDKKITINILFVDSVDDMLNNTIYSFYFGRKPIRKNEFNVFAQSDYMAALHLLESNDIFHKLYNKELLKLRKNSFMISTSYITCDLEEGSSPIQCQFYQYGISSSESPTVVVNKENIKYDTIKNALKNLWNDSETFDIFNP